MIKKIYDLFDNHKFVAASAATFATVFSAITSPDLWLFGSHYFAGAASAVALIFCIEDEGGD